MLRLIFAFLLLVLPAAAQTPAGNQTRLGVGDVITITLPGEDAFANPFKIDREGRLDLPEVGPVAVTGLTVAQAQERVRTALATTFRDLARFSLTLKERRLPLTVLGFVKQPGQIELAGGSTVQIAINAAGGLATGAQLDRMQLRRGGANGQVQVTTFDYKRYLDTGDGKLLPTMRPLDEIFVPASPLMGNVQMELDTRSLTPTGDAGEDRGAVRVFGEVQTSGTYSFKAGMTVMDALLRAGGVTRYAAVEQIRVLPPTGDPILFNLKGFLDTGNQSLNLPMAAGTTVFVPHEVEQVKSGGHVVYVMGEVAKPGAFEAAPGTGFFDILANAGGPTRFAEPRQIRIIRADGGVDTFNLAAYSESTNARVRPPVVNPGDAIFVSEKTQSPEQAAWLRTPPERSIRLLGAVRSSGRYEWSDEMSLIDLIAHAGGPNDKADLTKIEIVQGDSGPSIRFDMKNFLENGGRIASLPVIKGGYTVTVPEIPVSPNDVRMQWNQLSPDRAIHVFGAVGRPGRYAFSPDLTFLDVLSAADGPANAADLFNVRVTHRGESRDRVSKVNLAQFFQTGDDRLLPRVRPGDVIYVPDRNRNWLEQSPGSTVRLLGSVNKPGRYPFTDGMTILDLLAEAGGPAKEAYQERIVVVNLSCCANEARVFDLVKFAKTGDFGLLPVVREGDTVYVPNIDQSDWSIFMSNVRDAVSVLSIVGLMKLLVP